MIHYEHRTCPTDPALVQVRERPDPGLPAWRGPRWGEYMRCDSPRRAAEIVALLHPDDITAQVRP